MVRLVILRLELLNQATIKNMIKTKNGKIILSAITNNNEHQIIFNNYKDDENRSINCSIKLIPTGNFAKRFIIGVKYILGINSDDNQFEHFVINKNHSVGLMEIVTKLNVDSNFIKHAMRELEIAGYFKGEEMNALMSKQIIELLSVFATHGHSGTSAPFAINLFKRLASFEIISPLTFKDDEFTKSSMSHDCLQNNRYSAVFKDGKGVYNIYAFTKHITSSKYVDSDKLVKIDGGCWTGTVFEVKNGIATGRGFRTTYFKEKDVVKGCIPKKTILLPCTQIEVQKDNYLTFVDHKSTALRDLSKSYDIDWFEVESLKDKEIIKLTESYGY